jgi:hypothetical protein
MILYLAALQTMPTDLREAAALEGSSRWNYFRRVILPLLMPTTLFVLVNAVINAFRLVDHVVVMTRGGPDNATALLLYYVYAIGFRFWDSAYAAALTMVLLLILGPQLARQDLRGDLPNTDILKTYPLHGWQIVCGELLTPLVVLDRVNLRRDNGYSIGNVIYLSTFSKTLAPGLRLGWIVAPADVIFSYGDEPAGGIAKRLSALIPNTPGVVIANRYNFSLDQRISIRGFGSRSNFGVRGLKIFLDGVPQTLPDGQSQLTNIDFADIDEIRATRVFRFRADFERSPRPTGRSSVYRIL